MKKLYLTLTICILSIIGLVLLSIFEVITNELVAKITLFITIVIAFTISYLTGIKKGKNGLTNGLIIGISIALLSLIIHFLLRNEFFDMFYIRGTVYMASAGAGGIIGVNKNQ